MEVREDTENQVRSGPKCLPTKKGCNGGGSMGSPNKFPQPPYRATVLVAGISQLKRNPLSNSRKAAESQQSIKTLRNQRREGTSGIGQGKL